MRAIVEALAAGQITPSEATAAIQVVEACRRVADAAASEAKVLPPTITIGFVQPPVEELGD
jgi:hypothetical protein